MALPEDAEEWLERWISSHGDRITQFAHSYLRDWDEAQDVAQETFIRLFEAHQRRPRVTFSPAWLYQVAHRICIDRYRKRRSSERTAADAGNAALGVTHVTTDALLVHDTLERLPPRDRECLWLLYYEDLSIQEIANLLHLTPESVRARLSRARSRFRASWGGEPDGTDR